MVSGARPAISVAHGERGRRGRRSRLASPRRSEVGRVELLARQQHGAGRTGPGQQGEALRRPVVGHEPELGRRDAEAGVRGDDPEVTRDGQLRARAEGGAVDGGDRADGHVLRVSSVR